MVNQESAQQAQAQVEQGLGLLLAQVCRAHRNVVAVALDQISVSVGQDHFVYRLAIDEGTTQSQLAGALCVDTSTVAKTLARLERDCIVERRPDPTDGRVSRVYLTEHGRALIRPVLDIWAGTEQRLVRNLSEAERLLLRRLLQQVLSNLA